MQFLYFRLLWWISDRQIIEHILDNSMFDSGNNIMAVRGIMVQDLFANQNVYVKYANNVQEQVSI